MGIADVVGSASAHVAALSEIDMHLRACRDESACELATRLAHEAGDPRTKARALLAKLAALDNLGRLSDAPAVIDECFDILRNLDDHELLANLYALAGGMAAADSLERCMRHLLHSSRELDQVRTPTHEFCRAAHNLATAYSYLGFHSQAMAAAERGYVSQRDLGLPVVDEAMPEIAVRWALSRDHMGDSDSCVHKLRELLRRWSGRGGAGRMPGIESYYYGYAALRLQTLGVDTRVEARWIAAEHSDRWEARDLTLLSRACVAIIDMRAQEALNLLSGGDVNPYTVGAAEIHRVRSLAYSAVGDSTAALRADRTATRVATERVDTLHDRFVDGTQTQLDHESLSRMVNRYACEALTDTLTGLPNRRHFDHTVAQLRGGASPHSLGVIDLDGFKDVNTRHGHLSGDLVLKRVATVLARTLRTGDFLARFGGDEFVIVLANTSLRTAREIGTRMTSAVAQEDWEALVPGTPVTVTIGWSEFTDATQLRQALQTADETMLVHKDTAPSR